MLKCNHTFRELIILGDSAEGAAGIAAIPGREQAFKDSIHMAIEYCNALQCSR